MAGITLEQLEKRYDGSVQAVFPLDLSVEDGELMVLIGPSGSGKTTVLRMIAGLEESTGGSIRIGGRDVTATAPRDRDIAMVFQNYGLYPHLKVRDNLSFGLRVRHVERQVIEERVTEAARMLGIVPLLDRRPRQLSGGERQRVAMGRAIVREPAAFLMDEPLSNLDAKLRIQMRNDLVSLQRRLGTTTVYVTHDQIEAMTMGDRVAVLDQGVLQQVGSPRDLYDSPCNAFVAGFLGYPSMNLLPGTLSISSGVATVTIGGFELPVPVDRVPAGVGGDPRAVVVGLRPEACEEARSTRLAPAGARLSGLAHRVETLGADVVVHLRLGCTSPEPGTTPPMVDEVGTEGTSGELVARFDRRTSAREGDSLDVVIDTDRLIFFDPGTGVALR
ncbi:MAG: ABC transporter ATP-binding protein [Acidimicrobiales bacterium]